MHAGVDVAVDDVMIVFTLLLGLVLGSFLNVVGYRVPRKESVVVPGSHCPHCQTPLRPFELIPVVSWLLLKGTCRTCKASISVLYPVIELATGILFVVTYLLLPFGAFGQMATWDVFWLILMAVVATDLTSMKVPNVISLPGAFILIVLAIITQVQTWQQTLLGAAVCFLVLFLLHILSRGNMGMGDVKLYASIGAILGWVGGLESLVAASMLGSIVGVPLRVVGVISKRQHIPFVPFIAMGVVVIVLFGHELTHWYLHRVIHIS